MAEEKKIFLLDTNVLVHDPNAFYSFGKNIVGIPLVALQELDHFKAENSPRGRSTRQAIRNLDELREQGSLKDGVVTSSGTEVKVYFKTHDDMPMATHDSLENDNIIIDIARELKETGNNVILISKDINMRVRADAIGITTEDYVKHIITEDLVYKGWRRVSVPAVALKRGVQEYLNELLEQKENPLVRNEYLFLASEHNDYNYRIFRYKGGREFAPVEQPRFPWPIEGKNPEQIMAFDALLDPDIQFITLIGGAGTGKTFLALVAGLFETLVRHGYERFLVTRPIVPLGQDIGYLPGDVQEKLHSWMQPIYDNMEFIVHLANKGAQQISGGEDRKGKKGQKQPHDQYGVAPLDDLIKRGKVSLEAITYMRGRSIPYQYILIDEVQNLTPHEVKTLITRVGEGSKIILAGDPYQIDSPYLDFSSNGLVVASEKFKGESYFATVFLQASERSILSQRASELL